MGKSHRKRLRPNSNKKSESSVSKKVKVEPDAVADVEEDKEEAEAVKVQEMEDEDQLETKGAAPVEAITAEKLDRRVQSWIEEQLGCDDTILLDELEDEIPVPDPDAPTTWKKTLEVPMRSRYFTEEEKSRCFKFECEWKKCSFMSGTEHKYFAHVEKHAAKAEANKFGSYDCEWDLCDFRTSTHGELRGHVHLHGYHTKLKVSGASLSMLMQFPNCNYDSRTRNSISNRPTRYVCEWEQCADEFDKAMGFFYHVRAHMQDAFPIGKKKSADPVRCRWSICTSQFKDASACLKHTKTHTGERDIACFTCGSMFYERTKYRDHLARQLDPVYRKYICQECDKGYATKRLLRSHMHSHARPYTCTLCTMTWCSQSELSRHITRRHLKERAFQCYKCEYRTFTKKTLTLHLLTHSSNKMFRCDEFGCNLAFPSEYYLKKHISNHYNIPPPHYECHLCDASFTLGHSLSKHLSFTHNVQRLPGYTRFRYKVDVDGTLRLDAYVDSKRKLRRASVNAQSEVDAEDSGTETTSRATKAAAKSAEKIAPTTTPQALRPVKGKIQINQMSQVGENKFAIELGLVANENEREAEDAPVAGRKGQTTRNDSKHSLAYKEDLQPEGLKDDKKTNKPKKVQEFTVMQRYLKSGKILPSS